MPDEELISRLMRMESKFQFLGQHDYYCTVRDARKRIEDYGKKIAALKQLASSYEGDHYVSDG